MVSSQGWELSESSRAAVSSWPPCGSLPRSCGARAGRVPGFLETHLISLQSHVFTVACFFTMACFFSIPSLNNAPPPLSSIGWQRMLLINFHSRYRQPVQLLVGTQAVWTDGPLAPGHTATRSSGS